MIKGIRHVTICVEDQDRALKFYTEKLGFILLVDTPMGNGKQRWIELAIPNAETLVTLFTPEGHEDRVGTSSNVIFTTDNIEKTYTELKTRGVNFTKAPANEPWGSYALFQDSEGNTFCLSSSASF
ncbi:MAG TPA: VOC family protein [Rhabdochlamydiaceae bacterium]|nr:VOC family protein [Rhabdochlamydiaceae bacterium]